jgi:hypothetical protein
MPQRRQFLQSTAAMAASLSMPCDYVEAAAPPEPAPAADEGKPGSLLPTLKLGSYTVTRLIVGANPFYGYSHFNRLFSSHMTEWSTSERVCQVLKQCEANGINTWQFSHHDRSVADLKRHRAEGGRMQWILLSGREIEENPAKIREIAALKPIGVVHHGGSAERRRRAGELGKVRDFLKAVRDSGVMVGLSTHDPSFLEEVESKGWDVDFYMTALYYLTRTPEEFKRLLGTRPLGEIYIPEDPEKMCRAIRKTPKTCLCYKVLAAGRLTDSSEQIERAFRYTFENIKPQDGIIIGMYPRFFDQVRDNAERVRRLIPVTRSAAG